MDKEQLVDVRWLEPPEPFDRIVAAVEKLPVQGSLRVLIHREPRPLYNWLARAGYHYRTQYDPNGWFEIRITR